MNGLDLCRRYWTEVVGPVLAGELPDVRLAVGRIGPGSDVQGWDDATSRDHDWGLRLTFVLDGPGDAEAVSALLDRLPGTFAGVPTRFRRDPVDGVDLPGPDGDRHGHDICDLDAWLERRLGPARPPLDALDWLAVPEQSLLELTGGEVFRDDTGALAAARRALATFPDDAWIARLAAGWWHLSIESSYVGRAGSRGDELGWRLITARQVDRLAALAFLLARRYRPYRKWLGTALAALPAPGPEVRPWLVAAVQASTWTDARDCLGRAEAALAAHQSTLLPGSAPLRPPPYRPDLWSHDLPGIAAATAERVPERLRRRLRWPVGGADQFLDWPGNGGDAFLAARTYIGGGDG